MEQRIRHESNPRRNAATRATASILIAAVTVIPSAALALSNCKASIRVRDGVVLVKASTAVGPLLWGTSAGQEANAFFNAGTCDKLNGTWSQCTLGDAGVPDQASRTPPAGCVVYLRDQNGTGDQCAAYVKQCVPGMRAGLDAISEEDGGMTIRFTGVNVQIVDGSGDTGGATNGKGNLIIGYNEDEYASHTRTGSHNLVIGTEHTFSSFGGLVAGDRNSISAPGASVSGGRDNIASGTFASVSGGRSNLASDSFASVTGGNGNQANGVYASVTGGTGNTAIGYGSSVSGGAFNYASGTAASISGGSANEASFFESSVSGGRDNLASGQASSVSGGRNNIASGDASSVSAGGGLTAADGNLASGAFSSVSGGRANDATASTSTVSGGTGNNATFLNATVSGGAGRTASGTADWRGGLYFSDF